ncbi:HAD-IA family hydrolase [Reyranella sp.]|uniref:HAD-IA family hydrolase n=1 Tax=Reyranella sp. TaxID=1929291 RepID=UPI003D13283A
MKYDAVVFDLLTALLDSWTLWNAVAGSEEAGMRWRRRYLEITYGCGSYRPYETLVREAAADVGLPEGLAGALERRWPELQPWPEAAAVLKTIPVPLAVATNCSIRLGRQAADQVGVPFEVVETAESVGFYKPRPEVYRAVLQKLGTPAERTLFVAGSASDVPGAKAVGMPVYWHNRVGLPPRDDANPDYLEPSLDALGRLFPAV